MRAGLTEQQTEEAQRLAGEGFTRTDIADLIGTSRRTLDRAGFLPPARRGSRPKFDHAEARRLHAEGFTIPRLAAHFGVTTAPVYNAVHGRKPKPPDMRKYRAQGKRYDGAPCALCGREIEYRSFICSTCREAWRVGQEELLRRRTEAVCP